MAKKKIVFSRGDRMKFNIKKITPSIYKNIIKLPFMIAIYFMSFIGTMHLLLILYAFFIA